VSTYRLDKHAERKVARLLGGDRVGYLGGPDVVAGHLYVEVKTRRHLPAWLLEAVAQAKGYTDDQLPIVVLHRAGDPYADALVVLRMEDYLQWHGGG
jgi:hypothetical protein